MQATAAYRQGSGMTCVALTSRDKTIRGRFLLMSADKNTSTEQTFVKISMAAGCCILVSVGVRMLTSDSLDGTGSINFLILKDPEPLQHTSGRAYP